MRASRTLRILLFATAALLTQASRCGGGGSGGGGNRGDDTLTPEELGAMGARGTMPKDGRVGTATVIPTRTPRGPGYGRTDGTQVRGVAAEPNP